MSISNLNSADLCVTIMPDKLGFTETSELLEYESLWIVQARGRTIPEIYDQL